MHDAFQGVLAPSSKHDASKGKSNSTLFEADDNDEDDDEEGSSGDEEEDSDEEDGGIADAWEDEEGDGDEGAHETKFEKKAKKRSAADARDRKLADAEAEAMLQINAADVWTTLVTKLIHACITVLALRSKMRCGQAMFAARQRMNVKP